MSSLPAALVLALAFAAAPASPTDVRAWLEAADAVRRPAGEAVVEARATGEGAAAETVAFDVYIKGRDRALIVFKSGKARGRKILSSGEKTWLLVPGSSRAIPVSANQKLAGGASFQDVARISFSEDFTATARPEPETIDGAALSAFDLTAVAAKAPYPKATLWMDAQRRPRRAIFLLASGKAAHEILFTKFVTERGRERLAEMEVRDLLRAGTRTRLEYLSWKTAQLDDAIFTPEGARGL
jgi:hypothetical protein